jgi:hypothetical protein
MTRIDQAILDTLERQSFSYLREIVVHRHLTQSLGFPVKHLRWVPHTPKATQEAKCVTLSNRLLCQLRSIEHHGWQFIITFDELWFYFSPDHEHVWLCPDK